MTTGGSMILVRLPDDSTRELSAGSTGIDLAQAIGKRLAQAAVATVINGVESDLGVALVDGAKVSIITSDSEAGRHVLRHSTAHVLAQAVVQLFEGAKFSIGPAIEDGFYYDFELPNNKTFSDQDLVAIQERMQKIVEADQPFVRAEMTTKEALKIFKDQPYKCEIIERVTKGNGDLSDALEAGSADAVSVYRNSESFVDLCRGPHVSSTGRLGHFALMKVAGAYWRGNEKGPMLQRIYGTAWESKSALAEHLHRLEEAEKRDHRRLAVEMDLLSFPQELGGGLAVWHPKGGIIRKLMEDYSRERHQNGGYKFVFTPHLANAHLFETSGHLQFYKDGMYPPM
ncbi:MAG: threonine--tRNA ligase, partial [Actinobacteria bacterium]|nr:threonine--tRNA ligase [Actinomycetota bacterium]